MSILLKYQSGGKFREFKNSLPDNLKNTPNYQYDMRYLWKKSGKPQDFNQALNAKIFSLEDDGFYHAPSVESNTLRFLKPKSHPTVQMELDWYNSDEPEAIEFRKNYELKKRPLLRYYKYKERN